jgi:NAD(P)H-dependent FMN reductase
VRICLLVGSNRLGSSSARVGRYLAMQLATHQPAPEVDQIELAHCELPLWSDEVWDGTSVLAARWSERLQQADGLVIIAPEWNGSVPPALSNFLMYCSPAELGHKPGLLVAVSSGLGGSYPIAQLRMSASKNNRLCLIPEHVIVRQAGEMLVEARPASAHDAELRSRLEHATALLLAYAESLAAMRLRAPFDFERHPYGM